MRQLEVGAVCLVSASLIQPDNKAKGKAIVAAEVHHIPEFLPATQTSFPFLCLIAGLRSERA